MAFLENLDKKLTQVGEAAARATQNITGSSKTNPELEEARIKLEQSYEEIGRQYIENNKHALPPEYQELYNQITASEKRLQDLDSQVQAAASSEMRCPHCHAAIPAGSSFCLSCGASIQPTSQHSQAQANKASQETSQTDEPQGTRPGTAPNSGAGYQAAQVPPQMYGGIYPYITEEQLPAKFKPITAWGYFGWAILFSLPFIGIIIALIKAFGNTENVHLKNYARSMFCYYVVVLILMIFIFGIAGCSSALFYGMM